MRHTFNIKPLITAISALSIASVASAAGLERSGQDVSAFLQDGTYAETVYTYIDADVTGVDSSGNKLDDIAEDYDFFRYGVKTDVNDTFSVGVLYDEPWGAAADYVGENDFVGAPTEFMNGIIKKRLGGLGVNDIAGLKGLIGRTGKAIAEGQKKIEAAEAAIKDNPALETGLRPQIDADKKQLEEGKAKYAQLKGLEGVIDARVANKDETQVEVRTESLTGLLGMKFGQNKEFQIYGGPVAQRLKAEVHLRGNAYENATGYDLSFNPNIDYGWIAGASYSKPEIALKAALTYRSEIDHTVKAAESMPLSALIGLDSIQTNDMKITTPESVNFDFQTGINPTTLATAKVRWVPWSDFSITPPLYNTASVESGLYGKNGLNLVDYDDDQWLVELGLAKRLTPKLAVSGSIGWDSGAGDPVTSLGPIEGYYSVGLGAKYNLTENWAVSGGGKYLKFGDAEGKIPNNNIVSKFEDNDGFAFGVKVSYQSK